MARNLRQFLQTLDAAGELHVVTEPVSPILEISAIADRHSKSPAPSLSEHAMAFDPMHCERGGKALLFEKVEGCDFPLCINVFGSYRRMELALGVDGKGGGFEAIAAKIASLTKPQPPRSLKEIISKGREFLPLLRTPPRTVRRGRCHEVVNLTERGEVDLTRLPLIKCWPLDGDPPTCGINVSPEQAGTADGEGRYITFAGMHTIHADDDGEAKPASHNIGMYRAQLIDATRLVMHWHIHHDGAAHWRSWKRAGKPMPIAIALGGEPILPYAATAPLPPGLSELLMAGFLNGRGIPMVRCKTVPLRVPANSEIVIEGWVSTECGEIGWEPVVQVSDLHREDENHSLPSNAGAGRRPAPPASIDLGPGAAFEGPFGDHTGYYSLPDRYPIVEVTAITHARDAVYPTTIVGPPPQEDYYLGKATERIFLPLLRTIIPDIDDYHLPLFGCFHNCAFIRIDKQYALQARRVMHAVWGAGQMAWTKMIVVVDKDVNVHDEESVLQAMFEHCVFSRDTEMVNGPLDILDHAAPRLGAGCKIGFDATRKIAGEQVNGIDWQARPECSTELHRQMSMALNECVGRAGIVDVHAPKGGGGRCAFIAVEKEQAGQGGAAIEAVWDSLDRGAHFVIAVDASVNVHDWQETMFHCCANTDPGRDLWQRGDRMGVDATTKLPGDARHGQPVRSYPPYMQMTDDVQQRINDRAAAFGLQPR